MVGVAYYLVDTGHLYVMPDAAEREDFGLLRRSKSNLHGVHVHGIFIVATSNNLQVLF